MSGPSADEVWRRLLTGRIAFDAARLAAGFGHPSARQAFGPWARHSEVPCALAWLSNRGLYRFACELDLDALALLGDIPTDGAPRSELAALIRDQASIAFLGRCSCLQRGRALDRSDRIRALARGLRFAARPSTPQARSRSRAGASLVEAVRGAVLEGTEVRRAFLSAGAATPSARRRALSALRRAAHHHRDAGALRRAILEPEQDPRPSGELWQRRRLGCFLVEAPGPRLGLDGS